MKYNYKPTVDEDVNRLIFIFDNQIKREYVTHNGNKFQCPSYWHKLIFLESLDMEIMDWRKLRNDEYYKMKDSLTGISKLAFVLEKIQEFKKNN
jgi:hypothetical protein